jgi:hypothetical protein
LVLKYHLRIHVYFSIKIKNNPVYIYLHVEDLAIFGKDVTEFKNKIKKQFSMKDSGEASFLLGMKIIQSSNKISLSQEAYIDSLISM